VLQVRYLGAIGGKDVAETTRRILRNLMTNAVARRMNFAGRGSKTGISELKILDVVIGKEMFFLCFIRDEDSSPYFLNSNLSPTPFALNSDSTRNLRGSDANDTILDPLAPHLTLYAWDLTPSKLALQVEAKR
jgi:hypothetical protein